MGLAQAQGWMAVTPAELERARALVAALHADPDARKLLRGGKKERTIIQPRASGLLPLKARLDVHHESHAASRRTENDVESCGGGDGDGTLSLPVERGVLRRDQPVARAFTSCLSRPASRWRWR